MFLTHLSLTNFRNYARLELELPMRPIIIVGDNAQGKSNLLEAIYLLATTRSFRAGSDRELINWLALPQMTSSAAEGPSLSDEGTLRSEEETPFARLVARVQKEHSTLRIEVVIRADAVRQNGNNGNGSPTVSKRIKVNNVARRAIDLVGQVNAVMFSPQDIELVGGPPQLRRRYIDVTISQVDPRYCRTLAHYNRVLLQRNHLLRQIRDSFRGRTGSAAGRTSPDQLLFWDQELANAGAYIILQRLETVDLLDELTFGLHRRLTGSQERLRIVPKLSLEGISPDSGPPWPPLATSEAKISAIAELFRRQLTQCQQREIAYGMSLVGPHRDDLGFLVDDRDMNVYGSRGQQRTVALSLKLAEMEFMRKRTGEEPILLLDDVASELDAQRRHHVLAAARSHQQVIVTTTDLGAFDREFFDGATVLRVENGAIEGQ